LFCLKTLEDFHAGAREFGESNRSAARFPFWEPASHTLTRTLFRVTRPEAHRLGVLATGDAGRTADHSTPLRFGRDDV